MACSIIPHCNICLYCISLNFLLKWMATIRIFYIAFIEKHTIDAVSKWSISNYLRNNIFPSVVYRRITCVFVRIRMNITRRPSGLSDILFRMRTKHTGYSTINHTWKNIISILTRHTGRTTLGKNRNYFLR